MRRLAVVFAMGTWLVACGDDGPAGSSSDSTSSTSTPSDTNSSSGGSTSTGTGGTGGTATTTTPCAHGCVRAAVHGGCGVLSVRQRRLPRAVPKNYKCVDGNGEKVRRPPECATNEECNEGGVGPKLCKPLTTGVALCVVPCLSDAECAGQSECIGMTMDGTAYCTVEVPPIDCQPGEVCRKWHLLEHRGQLRLH